MSNEITVPVLAFLQSKVNLTETSLQLPEKLTEKQWEDIGRGLGKLDQTTQWWVGDWWAFGEHKYGDRKALVESEEWTGPAYQSCKGAGWVVGKIEKVRRRTLLSFEHHKEVAALPPDEADTILDWAENGGQPKTIREVRERVKQVKAYLAQGWNSSQLERRKLAESGQTVLANLTNGQNGLPVDNALITWAESQDLAQRIDRHTDWGNPYEIGADGTRDEVIKWYAEYFAHKRSLHKRLDELKGKVLLCWCYPQPCHGHFLLEQANGNR